MEIKTEINKRDSIKPKSFCTAKETVSKVKRQPTEWEKIFANEATDKGLISKTSKQLMKLNIKKKSENGHAKLLHSYLTLCNIMDCSMPDSSVHGILQARNWSG